MDDWKSISQSSGFEVLPIIEALPLEIWIASLFEARVISEDDLIDGRQPINDDQSDEAVLKKVVSEPEAPSRIEISDKEILRLLPQALENELVSWTREVGLESYSKALVLDPRLSVRSSLSVRSAKLQ